MICYRKVNGKADNLRFVERGYKPQASEILIEGDVLPPLADLSDPPTERELAAQKIPALEKATPITHRALREFFIGFGAAFPDFQQTLLYQRAKATDDAIKIERAKL